MVSLYQKNQINVSINMINNERTLSDFGYTYEDLSPSSTKTVCITCDFCNNNFLRKKYHMNKGNRGEYPHACTKCDQVKSNWKKNNPNNLNPTEFYNAYPKIDLSRINREKTKMKFGYDPSDLSYRSEKPVITKCDFCDKEYETNIVSLMRTPGCCCIKCSSINSHYLRLNSSLNKNEFFNKYHNNLSLKNVDIKTTIEKLGYDPEGISSKSEKQIYVSCCICEESFLTTRISYFTKANNEISCKNCRTKKTQRTLLDRYGVTNTLSIPNVQSKLTNPLTERIVASLLTEYGIKFTRNYSIGPYSFDFFLNDLNLLIECHGDYFHDFKNNGYEGTPRDKSKTTYVEKYTNHKLIWIWEHEIHSGRIKKILGFHLGNLKCDKLYIEEKNNIEVKVISKSDAHQFLSQYHYLGNLGTAASPFGAFHNDELIAVMVIGGLTRKSSIGKINKETKKSFLPGQVKELRRFCIRPNIESKNLASYLITRMIKLIDEKIKVISSFSDPTVGDIGTIYKAMNWIQLSKTSDSYHYLDVVTMRPIHKKTVYEMAVSAKMKEKEFVSKVGFIKVKELPKESFVLIRK